ncbi:IS1634 family transposase, partial [Nostoc sp. B(2019)]|nr:IS1634 family transposase [Nostoc sp. B(2019)]
QRWVIVESLARMHSDKKQLEKKLEQLDASLSKELYALCSQRFQCETDALAACERFANKLNYHCLEDIRVVKHTHYSQKGRPRKDALSQFSYQLTASLVRSKTKIESVMVGFGRFILATNVTDIHQLPTQQVLLEYKQQQSPERGFRFLKDPLFFTSSVFVKSPERVAALAMLMGLCLLVYSLGQRQLRKTLVESGETVKNQLGKPIQTPTLRWVFQCFQDVHLLINNGRKQVANLTQQRIWILRFLGTACGRYYLVC